MKNKMRIRNATFEDSKQIKILSDLVYPLLRPYIENKISAQIANYPEGVFVAENDGGEIVGYTACLRMLESIVLQDHTWLDITGYGFGSTHIPDGDCLYGYEFLVSSECRGQGLGKTLNDARKELCRRIHVNGLFLGTRIPGFSHYLLCNPSVSISAKEYVDEVVARRISDPVLSFQLKQGFRVVRILKNYNSSDMESFGYAVLMVWQP